MSFEKRNSLSLLFGLTALILTLFTSPRRQRAC